MEIIEILKTILLGIVEGVTEWLPISSTGHMILVEEFIQLNASAEFKEMFFVVIQLGAIMAVIFLYFHKLNPFARNKSFSERQDTWQTWYKVAVGIIPAGVLGLFFDDWLNEHLYNYQTVSLVLIIYGVLFIMVENHNEKKIPQITTFADLSYRTAFNIGCFQALSLIPGTSRSGATILGAILLGTSRQVATEYSFFLSIPVMFGASALKLYKFGFAFSAYEIVTLLVGMVVAFVVSMVAIKFLLSYIKNNTFKAFGWYRIVLGVVVIAYFLWRG